MDGLLLWQLRLELKGLGFRGAREEGVSPGRHPQALSGQPRPQPAPSHMGRCRSGSLVLGTGAEDYFLALFLGCGETLAQLPCTLPGPPTTFAK